jgi:transcriptional regulator of acetoin/glycerol metabolism
MLGPVPSDTTIPDVDIAAAAGDKNALGIRWVFPAGGRVSRLAAGTTVFGREPAPGVSLPGASISRRHAEIRWSGGGIPMLRDLESRNGVFLNGRRVSQAPLRPRDVLRFGEWVGVLATLAADDAADAADAGGAEVDAWRLEEVTKGYWAGPVLRARLAPARLIAATDLPVVIQGETGVGKEGAARAIHAWSGRTGPFLGLNCATLPEALAEAELFGYRKGAFSSADRASPGFLRAAEGGTLFLDEIGDLPLGIQAKLLRALEENEVIPLGETRPVPTDVRLVAATHVPLREAVAKERFRQDLFGRLKGFILEIPPLRERVEEVPALFLELLAQRRPAEGRPALDVGFVEGLCLHPWPFNMRDLTSLVVRLLALHPGAPVFDRAKLDAMLEQDRMPAEAARPDSAADGDGGAAAAAAEARPDPDAQTFIDCLRRNSGNVRKTAADLGISRGRAYRMMEKMDAVDLASLRR